MGADPVHSGSVEIDAAIDPGALDSPALARLDLGAAAVFLMMTHRGSCHCGRVSFEFACRQTWKPSTAIARCALKSASFAWS